MQSTPTPLSIAPEDELDLQIGEGLVDAIIESGFKKIRELRARLASDGLRLPLVRVRNNSTLPPHRFLLHHCGRLKAGGDFVSISDILQTLSDTAVPTPPPQTVAEDTASGREIIVN